MKESLERKLREYGETDCYPFHMPGHKRQRLGDWTPEEIDITEIEGFDNLHHAEGILREGQERLAEVFGADHSFYLVNGSTCGLLAAISAVTRMGDRILVARNCHKAVYHAMYLRQLRAEYLYPLPTDFGIQGSIDPCEVEERLRQEPGVRAVVITSPTYDGVVSDIRSIAEIVHAHGIPLIVDEAHGAHFGFSDGFPEKAMACGADLVIESVHKTLPAYTQSAVLHVMDRPWVELASVKRYLGIYQSSSPSYVLMAGIDRCVALLAERGEELFSAYERRLRDFYRAAGALREIRVFPYKNQDPGIWARDISKLLISTAGRRLTGKQLEDWLRSSYHLELEMSSGHYATALTSLIDTQDGFARLTEALREMDARLTMDRKSGEPSAAAQSCGAAAPQTSGAGKYASAEKLHTAGDEEPRSIAVSASAAEPFVPTELYTPREKRLEIFEAMDAPWKRVPLSAAAGHVSGEFIYLYPPGIPILAPGELLSGDVLSVLLTCQAQGFSLQGMDDLSGQVLRVVSERS